MVTSAEFDKVLVPVDYQKDVLFRTFDTLIGFNKKNKKGKFMKAIKEEWTYDPKTGKQVFVDRQKASDEKTAHFKRVNLDQKMSKPSVTAAEKKTKTAEEKTKGKELYQGHLLNKVGKTLDQIEKDAKEKVKVTKAIKGEIKEPGDTHYTITELAEKIWPISPKTRERHSGSIIAFKQALSKDEGYRKRADEFLIKKIGHKTEEEMKTAKKSASETKAKKAEKIDKAKLETDIHKIADWFWDRKDTKDFKVIFPDATSYPKLFRMIQNDDRGPEWFAKIMFRNGYLKDVEKPFVRKAVLIKKGDAACDWEKEGEAAVDFDEKDSDAVWNNIKSFFTSWAKECGYKLTPEALKKFKENVYKSIIYYNTMYILKGDK